MALANPETRQGYRERLQKKVNILNRIESNFRAIKSPCNRTEGMLQIKKETEGGRFKHENPLCNDPVYAKIIDLAKEYDREVNAVYHTTKYPQYLPQEKADKFDHNYRMLYALMNQLSKIEKRTMKAHEYTFFLNASIDEIIETASKTENNWDLLPEPKNN